MITQLQHSEEYRKVVANYQKYIQEHPTKRQQIGSSDRLNVAMKNIYLNPLLPQLQIQPDKELPSTNRQSRRAISLLRDPYQEYRQSSQMLVSNNLQPSLINAQHTGSKKELDVSLNGSGHKKNFFMGLYKNQSKDTPFKNVKIRDLVNQASPHSKSRPQLLPILSNEMHMGRYFTKQRKRRPTKELSFTNKWERDRGTTFISLDNASAIQLAEEMIRIIENHDIMRQLLENISIIQFRSRLTQLISSIYYDGEIDFDTVFNYFSTLKLTYLEVFYIKYSLAQALLYYQYSYSQIDKALNQFEEYRYLLIKPIVFVSKLFDNAFYGSIVKQFIMKLLKSPSYIKFLSQSKLESGQLITNVKNSLFPYLVGEYLALPYHASHKDIRAESFRQQLLIPYINSTFMIQLRNLLKEQQVDEVYIYDVERRLTQPNNKQLPQYVEYCSFGLFYVDRWVQSQTHLIPSADIKALLRLVPLVITASDDPTKTMLDDNLQYLSQFNHIYPQIQLLF